MILYQPSTKHFKQNPAFSLMRCARHSELHWHNAIEFIYFLSGGLEISLNGVTYTPNKGDVIVINSSIVHSFVITKAPVDYYVLIASDDYFKNSGLYSDTLYFTPFIKDDNVKSLFEKIVLEYEKKDEFSNPAILSLLTSIFVYLRRNYTCHADKVFPVEKKKINMVRDAIEFIKNNYFDNFMVEDISNRLHFSKSYLSHTFKDVTGYSLVGYINLVRCQNARALLMENKSVSETALACGFSEVSYFTRVFKKTMGVLPSEANKEHYTLYNHLDIN